MSKYKVVISGLGNIAWKYNKIINIDLSLTHTETILKNQKCILSGGFSPVLSDRVEFQEKYGITTYDNFVSMIEDVKPDIVSICSPSEFHFSQVDHCLDAEIPMIWLEKPPAVTLEQMDQLIDKQLKKQKTAILVNFQRRYNERYQQLKDAVQEKIFGHISYITVTYSRGLLNNGSHIIDILNYIMGDEKPKFENIINNKCKDNPSFSLIYHGDVLAVVIGAMLPYHCLDISVTCETGRMSVLYGGMDCIVENKVEHEFYPGFYRLKDNPNHSVCSIVDNSSMDKSFDNLILSYEQEKEPVSSLKTSMNTMSVIEEVLNCNGITF